MSCVDNTTAAHFVEGHLEGVKAAEVEAHIDDCADCRALLAGLAKAAFDVTGLRETLPDERVAVLARLAAVDTPAGAAAAAEPSEGSTLSRYVILGRIGAGGMGIVYAAFDPQLDRKVAIKLLNPARGRREDSGEARSRLMREAQAMARLAHPNTVVVHDVGTFGDQVFVAMEFVDGGTLRSWLAAEPRGWREVVDMFLAAGRGLAAAHAAQIVHRDFKPDNVLVGKDGRVAVTDFGLARAGGEDKPPPAAEIPPAVEAMDTLTRTGVVVGTPAYMAPEQLEGQIVDARSDQFSFCVALWEALSGRRPFAGKSLRELGDAIRARRLEEPKQTGTPAWLRRVVEKGLAPTPAERHASMPALLEALERDPAAARRRWIVGGAVVAAIAAAIIGGRLAGRGASQVCKGAEQKLAGVWDAPRRQAVGAAFTATSHPHAATAFASVSAALDEYAAGWAAMHVAACAATRVSGEQSADVLDLRMTCLEQRRLSLGALVDVLAKIDAKNVDKAVSVARSLPSLRGCADVAALKARVPPPTDPVLLGQVQDLRKELIEIKTMVDFGDYARALERATPAAARGRELKYRPMEAEAVYFLARIQDALGKRKEAEDTLLEAVWAAEAGHEDGVAIQVLAYLAYVVGNEDQRYVDAERHLRQADALMERRGPDPELEAQIANARGNLAGAQDRFDEAYPNHKRAIELWEKLLGADHPRLAIAYANLGMDARHVDKLDESLAYTQRAGAIWEKTYGAEFPYLVGIELQLGSLYSEQNRFDQALAHDQKALALAEKVYGPEHPEVASALNNLGVLHDDFDQDEQALVYYQRCLDLRKKLDGEGSVEVAAQLNNIGNIRQKQKRWADALPLHEQAVAIYEQKLGDKNPKLSVVLNNLASAEMELGHLERALAVEERALALFDQKFGKPKDLADIQFVTAQVLTALGRDRPRALELAQKAVDNYDQGGRKDKPELARARTWLEGHRR